MLFLMKKEMNMGRCQRIISNCNSLIIFKMVKAQEENHSMDSKGKISVIVPAYNAGLYLKQCVDSVLNQTYEDFEVIIIDDGSIDNTLEIARKLAEKDSRVKLVHQENKGLATARNSGLEKMKGDYVFFLDADDWIENICFEEIIEELINSKSDIVYFSYYKEYTNKTVENHVFNSKITYENGYTGDLNIYDMRMITAWGKLYKSSCIGNLRYDVKMRTAEDVDFNFRVYANIKKAVYLPKCPLHYRILEKSAIHGYDKNVEEKFKYPLNTIRKKMLSKNDVEKRAYFSFAAISYIVIMQNSIALNIDLSHKQKLGAVKDLNKKDWVRELFENVEQIDIPMSRKLVIICGKHGLNLGVLAAVEIKKLMEK